jgi:ELMO domain-containing protein
MGMLGLENLLHFAIEYPGACRQVLSHSLHPTWGYTFAIVGINLTAMATRLLKTNLAKTHFYNLSKKLLTIQQFHQFYVFLFYEFDKLWMKEKPKSIMDFSHIQEKFETNILCALDKDDCLFKINLAVENV